MKCLLITLLSLLPLLGLAQQKPQNPPEYQLSTHILDINKGMPAPGVMVRLSKFNAAKKSWEIVAEKQTNDAGRINDFLPTAGKPGVQQGIFKLTFQTKPYFASKKQESFYPFIEVVFELTDGAHYHVPITLSAFGYSTYRGS